MIKPSNSRISCSSSFFVNWNPVGLFGESRYSIFAFLELDMNFSSSSVMLFVKGILIVGIEYSLHRSSKKPNVGSDVKIFVSVDAKFASIKSITWSDPFPTPIISGGILV